MTGHPLSEEAKLTRKGAHQRRFGAGVGGRQVCEWGQGAATSLLCVTGVLYSPTPTPHIHTKIGNDYCLLTRFFFSLCFTEDSFLSPLPAASDSDTPPGPQSHTQSYEALQPDWVKDGGEGSEGTAVQSLSSAVRQARPCDLSQDTKPLSLSFLICKMDSNTIYFIRLLGVLYDTLNGYHLAKDLEHKAHLMNVDLATTTKIV